MDKALQVIVNEEEGLIEFTEIDREEDTQPMDDDSRKSVTSYKRWTSHGYESYEAYFFIATPQRVHVRSRVQGKVRMSLSFFNVTHNHGGPTLPQTGGSAELDAGYWKLYFMGSISSRSSIHATVRYE